MTDPLSNTSAQFVDGVGRVISAVDALGNTVKSQYNPLNLVTQVVVSADQAVLSDRGSRFRFAQPPSAESAWG